MIIAVVGSGGKTTLIKKLAAQYRGEGKKVLITPSTHMFVEADTLLTDDADTIIRALKETGFVMAGIADGVKLKALSAQTFEAVRHHADVVLVEADGSRMLPLKFPNATEPVIPEKVDQIFVVWGPHGLGKPAKEVCPRLELVKQCLNITDNTIITLDHVRKLLEAGYLLPLKENYPQAEILVSPPL